MAPSGNSAMIVTASLPACSLPAAAPSLLRVAVPNFSVSSENITRTPRGAVENGTKPTLTASGIGKSSKIKAVAGSGTRRAVSKCFLFGCAALRQEHGPGHYDLSAAALPSVGSGWAATSHELLTISRGCLGAAILLTDQRDGS